MAHLTKAIDKLQSAIDIFDPTEHVSGASTNFYGLGLCQFTLGYIYENFVVQLSNRSNRLKKGTNDLVKKYIVKSD